MRLGRNFKVQLGDADGRVLGLHDGPVEGSRVGDLVDVLDARVGELSAELDLGVFEAAVVAVKRGKDNFLEHGNFGVHELGGALLVTLHAEGLYLVRRHAGLQINHDLVQVLVGFLNLRVLALLLFCRFHKLNKLLNANSKQVLQQPQADRPQAQEQLRVLCSQRREAQLV